MVRQPAGRRPAESVALDIARHFRWGAPTHERARERRMLTNIVHVQGPRCMALKDLLEPIVAPTCLAGRFRAPPSK